MGELGPIPWFKDSTVPRGRVFRGPGGNQGNRVGGGIAANPPTWREKQDLGKKKWSKHPLGSIKSDGGDRRRQVSRLSVGRRELEGIQMRDPVITAERAMLGEEGLKNGCRRIHGIIRRKQEN